MPQGAVKAGGTPMLEPTFEERLLFHCERGDATAMAKVLKEKPDSVNAAVGGDQGTALHHAAMHGHLLLTQTLLAAKADVESTGYTGKLSPLHLAAEEDQAKVCFELIAQKADPNLKDGAGQTPSHRAAFAGASMALRVLLASGANAAQQDVDRSTPLHYAAYAGRLKCVEAILDAQPEVVNLPGNEDSTALHLSAASGRTDVLKVLLAAGADMELMDEQRMTPLHRAASGCALSTKALLDAKANPAAEDTARWTPLHYACEYDLRDAVKALLEAGAKVDVLDTRRLTPLHVAAGEGHVLTSAMLMAVKADPRAKVGTGVASPLQLARRDPRTNADLLALFEMGYVHDPGTKADLLSLFELGYVKDKAVSDEDALSLLFSGYAPDRLPRITDQSLGPVIA